LRVRHLLREVRNRRRQRRCARHIFREGRLRHHLRRAQFHLAGQNLPLHYQTSFTPTGTFHHARIHRPQMRGHEQPGGQQNHPANHAYQTTRQFHFSSKIIAQYRSFLC
jgi:hypothetical protein